MYNLIRWLQNKIAAFIMNSNPFDKYTAKLFITMNKKGGIIMGISTRGIKIDTKSLWWNNLFDFWLLIGYN